MPYVDATLNHDGGAQNNTAAEILNTNKEPNFILWQRSLL